MKALRPGRLSNREALRLLPILGPVVAGGAASLVIASVLFGRDVPSGRTAATVAALALAVMLAEAFPVPVALFPAGTISVSAIFVVSAAVLHGTAAAVAVGFVGRIAVELVEHRPPPAFGIARSEPRVDEDPSAGARA